MYVFGATGNQCCLIMRACTPWPVQQFSHHRAQRSLQKAALFSLFSANLAQIVLIWDKLGTAFLSAGPSLSPCTDT